MKKLLDLLKVGLLISALTLVLLPVASQAAAAVGGVGDVSDVIDIIITDDCFGPADDCLVINRDGSILITSYWIIIIID